MPAGWDVVGWGVRLASEGRNEALKRPRGFWEVPRERGMGNRSGRWESTFVFGYVNFDSAIRLEWVISISATSPPPWEIRRGSNDIG